MQEKFKEIIVNYNEILDLNLSEIGEELVKLIVKKKDVDFEFLLRRKLNSDKAIIFGSGAYDYKTMELPVFQRYSWRDLFDENLIFYNDPTLYVGEVGIAWGYGSEEEHYLQTIGELIEIIMNKIEIKNNNIAIYGSSAGGFMALILACIIKGSKAVVNNPQTIVNNYYESALDNLFNYIYPNNTTQYALNIFPERVDAIKFYKKQNYIPEIIYYQNIACINDVNKQLIPFINKLRTLDEKAYVEKITLKLYANKEQNHSPLPMVETVNIIKKSINVETIYEKKLQIKSNDWNEFLRSEDYSIFKYDAEIYGKSVSYKYKIKLDNIEYVNRALRKIKSAGYCYIDDKGFIYVSILHSHICNNSNLSVEKIREYFQAIRVTIVY